MQARQTIDKRRISEKISIVLYFSSQLRSLVALRKAVELMDSCLLLFHVKWSEQGASSH